MKHIDYAGRLKIETLYNTGASEKYIAEYLGIHISTVYRELQRGMYTKLDYEYRYVKGYSADVAQQKYNYNSTSKGSQLKLGKDFRFIKFCEACILYLHWSPDAIIGFIQNRHIHFDCKVCTKTLYNYIEMGLFPHVTNKDLLRRGVKKQEYKKGRYKKPLNRSIEERPKHINNRIESGHWEMDTVIGKFDSKPCLLVLTERKTRQELIFKMPDRTQLSVKRVLDRLERHYHNFSDIFKSITMDNGSEFLSQSIIEQSCRSHKQKRTMAYYCHPYSSGERGSNENCNSIIRRFIPKGSLIENYSQEFITYMQNWINRYPRKILGYKSSGDMAKLHNIEVPNLCF